MKEIQKIIQTYDNIDLSNQKAALATVVHVEGSSYRRTGARMLIVEDGTWIGGISGGCLEGDALRKAKQAILKNKASVVRYDTREEDAYQIGVGLGCNGLIDVLIAPLDKKDKGNPAEILRSCILERNSNILITIIEAKDAFLKTGFVFKYKGQEQLQQFFKNEKVVDALESDIALARENHNSKTQFYEAENSNCKLFIEVLPPAIHLIIFGDNYDIYPLVDLAKAIGWKVTIVANPKKLAKPVFSKADAVVDKKKLGTTFGELSFDTYSAAVLMAHDYETDKNNFIKIVPTQASYIGLLGPLKRSKKIFEAAKLEGIPLGEPLQNRIHAPLGLDTGATTPEEIAIAMLAEIRTFFSNRKGGFLKDRQGPIHERES